MSRNVLVKICTVVLLFIGVKASAQLTITTQPNPTLLAQKILGTGVTVLNAQFSGNGLQAGFFKKTGSASFPLDSGIVLSSGQVKTGGGFNGIDQPATIQAQRDFGGPGDADLNIYAAPNPSAPLNTKDACILEFDFIPQGDSVYMRYFMASEEYPEFGCNSVNDAFGFLISGPGIFGKKMISTFQGIAGTLPVAINTINSGLYGNPAQCLAYGNGSPYTQYYVDHPTTQAYVYDGRTIVLIAKAKVIPCQTYHIKLVIADVGDGIYDSGVFIEANSFTSKKEINTSVQGPYTDPQNSNNVTMIEACKTAQIKLTRAADVTGPFSLVTTYAGTATPGVDFTTNLPATVSFTASETEKIYDFSAPADALNEGLEKIVVRFSKGTCTTTFVDSAILYIRDSLIYRSRRDSSFCTVNPITISGHDTVANVVNSYLWSTNANTRTITVSQPGLYTVTHTYSQRCLNVDTFNIISNDPQLSFSNPNVQICPGDTATLTVTTNASNLSWNTGATTNSIKVTAAGKYWVTGSNITCTKTDTVNVTVKPSPTVYLGIDTGMCQNKTLVLDASYPGASSVWSNGATGSSITVSTAGTYSVINTLNGCTAKDTINVTVNPIPAVYLGGDTSICADKTVQLNATYTGATYSWSNGATSATITVSSTGEYSVINNLNGCTATDTINVTSKPLPVLELGADRSVCNTDTIHLDATYPNTTYSWNNGATTGAIVAAAAGKYKVVSTLNGCSVTDSMTLTLKPIPTVNLGGDTSICENKTIILNATYAGATYLWSNGAGSATITVNTTGRYSVINSLNGCFAKDTIDITTKPIPALELGSDRSVCQQDTIHLDAFYPSTTYSWSNGATAANIVTAIAGKYTVVSTLNGCSNTDSMTLVVKPIPVVNLGIDTSICENITLLLNADYAGALHVWNTGAGSPVLPVSTTGQYWVMNTLNGCTDRDTINITTKAAPLLNLGADTSMCEYDQLTLNAYYPGAGYLWNNGDDSSAIVVTTAGKYSVVSTLSGCPATDTITIASKKMPVVNAGIDIVIQQNTSAQLNATPHSNNAVYLWSPAATLSDPSLRNPVATPVAPETEYTVHVVSVDGCIDEDKVVVRVVYPIRIPNAFSPNGDGVNDKWVITNLGLYPRSRVYIFNRYGQQIYSATGLIAWDGTFKGKLLEPATYYYVIDNGDGSPKHTGYVVLLR
jgi:gliding motility-associated-like protein